MDNHDIIALTEQVVADGLLGEEDVESIVAAAAVRSKQQPLTRAEIAHIMNTVQERTKIFAFDRLPLPLRILSIILMVSGVLGVVSGVMTLLSLVNTGVVADILKEVNVTTAVVIIIIATASFTSTVLSFFIGFRLIKGQRGAASTLILTNMAVTIVSSVCGVMLYGVGLLLVFDLVQIAVQIALSTYLNPSLTQESNLRLKLRRLDTETHALQGTLGLADPGEGFIRLDFFNLFWTFMVASLFGLIVEDIWHMTVYDLGVFQDRAGLLFGPFSPIYGVGAVLMTITLNRFKERNPLFLFAVCTVIGGAFEYFVSWFMEISIGASAWDYHDQFLGPLFDGRTCLLFAAMFGLMGLAWIKFFLPLLLRFINLIPLKLRYSATSICAVLMVVNATMTLQALDNWAARMNGHEPAVGIEQFYADNFDDDLMAHRFQSMAFDPAKSARA